MALPTVSAGLVNGLIRYAERQGADPVELACRARLNPAALADPDARLPVAAYLDLVSEAKAMLDDPALALHYAETVLMSDVSIVGLIMEASATIGEAYLQLRRYGRLAMEVDTTIDGGRFELVTENDRLYLIDRWPAPEGVRELTEMAFASLVCGPRRFLAQSPVLSVQFAYPAPAYLAEYERVFACPLEFDALRNALEMHPEALTWRVAQNPSYVFGMLTERADRLLLSLDLTRTTARRVEAILMTVLHQGDISAEDIAQELGFSRQTLFRRLRDEGTTFSDILKNLRQRLAIDYLRAGKASANEIAYLVGFSDAAAFSRAFKKWTGKTPGVYRSEGIN